MALSAQDRVQGRALPRTAQEQEQEQGQSSPPAAARADGRNGSSRIPKTEKAGRKQPLPARLFHTLNSPCANPHKYKPPKSSHSSQLT
ncbi:hypothetical protein D7X33_03250 [Butyricicoccus sp. 1XD8-22]|nr:hypothetical protein D7X33_03250 [Butyricicoccus sp. 1XD8-22]